MKKLKGENICKEFNLFERRLDLVKIQINHLYFTKDKSMPYFVYVKFYSDNFRMLNNIKYF